MKIRIFSFFIISLFLFLSFGCSENFPSEDIIKKSLPPNTIVQYDPIISPQNVNIIVDDSKSVSGFISDKNCDYLSKIREISSKISAEIQFYRMDSKTTLIDGSYNKCLDIISSKKFYKGNWTDLNSIFDLPNPSTTLNFIVTDGIQSTKNKFGLNQQAAFARNLSNYLSEENGFIGIFGFKSNFNGPYFCEAQKGTLQISNSERPFFIIALGKRIYLDYVIDKLSSNFEESFIVGEQSDMNFQLNYSKTLKGINKFKKMQHENLKTINEKDSLDITFNVNENISNTTLVLQQMLIQPITDSLTIIKKFKEIKSDFSELKKQKYKTTVKLPIEHTRENLLYLRFNFTSNIPRWIHEWSTDSDCNYDNALKVYSFDKWISYILNNLDTKSKTVYSYSTLIRRE